ncbi:DEAD/DEAH box helicase family protein [Alkalihalobacillus oceani]|uniref:DEAD/DEAH box helicase family protein n=1 Tax=Halalkalibacter oceani TaxID=1653776 RepID=A0A9X2DVR3_9BACI|nr:DEAD/DEAH box helicase family protein [Halalkalibacter oceani]MCM3716290.1 DEAD/DEAH box helicase family protein [Halalkalibacter oceani]
MKKIRINEDGKTFEAYVKMLILDGDVLVGCSFAGTAVAVRSIHASFYNIGTRIEVIDETTGQISYYTSTTRYRRVEEVVGRVVHCFMLPRSAVLREFQASLAENMKAAQNTLKSNKDKSKKFDYSYPERVVIARKGNINQVAGRFIAKTFGLPQKEAWSNKYIELLQEKITKLSIITTNLAGEWDQAEALRIHSLKEKEVLEIIEKEIQSGRLNPESNAPYIIKSEQAIYNAGMTTEQYLRKNAKALASKLEHYIRPTYKGDHYLPYIGQTERVCVPAQAKIVMGMHETLKKKKGVICVSDMGTGKTQMSLTTVFTAAKKRAEDKNIKDEFRALIIAPSNVIPKWSESEIPTVLGKSKTVWVTPGELSAFKKNERRFKFSQRFIVTTIESTDDALKYVQAVRSGWTVPSRMIHFVLISMDRMKYGAMKYVFAGRWDPVRNVWRSPETNQALQIPPSQKQLKRKKRAADEHAGWSDIVISPKHPPTLHQIQEARKKGTLAPNQLPKGYVQKWSEDIRAIQEVYFKPDKTKAKKHCTLYRPAQAKWGEMKGSHRWMIAQIFQKKLPNHFHIGIFDEVHKMHSTESGRGAAFHKILKSCRKSILLTGTLTNGESSSIFGILWRLFPGELINAGFSYETSKEAWAYRYGTVERIVTLDKGGRDLGATTNRVKDQVQIKEKPGISPELIANHLLDKCVFMNLPDLQIPLVELEERPILIKLDDDHYEEYQRLQKELYSTCQSLTKMVGTGAWAKYHPATLNYADQPSKGVKIEWYPKGVKKDQTNHLGKVEAPSFPESYLPAKERTLIDLVKSELAQDRPCVIYNHFTGKSGEYQTNQRLKKTLTDQGIKCKILDEGVPSHKRFEWLEEQVKLETKVIITNMKLVEVGLDLIYYPTYIYFQLCDEISILRQSSRRGFRLGQPKKCKVFFLVNEKTTQMEQFVRLMSRRIAALIAEGRMERSNELAKFANVASSGITNELSQELEKADIKQMWADVAAHDLDDELRLISEADFKEKISAAFRNLTAETKRLTGVKEIDPFAELTDEELDLALSVFDDVNFEVEPEDIDISEEKDAEVEVFSEAKSTKNDQSHEKKNEIVEYKVEVEPYNLQSKEKIRFEQQSLFDFAN